MMFPSHAHTRSKLAAFALFLGACSSTSTSPNVSAGGTGAVTSGAGMSGSAGLAVAGAMSDAHSSAGLGATSGTDSSAGGTSGIGGANEARAGSSGSSSTAGGTGGAGPVGGAGPAGSGGLAGSPGLAGSAGALTLTSSDFANGSAIPIDATCATSNAKPALPELMWSGVPAGTKSFALTFLDTTRLPNPQGDHYAIYDIRPDVTSLPRGLPAGSPPAGVANLAGAKQKNPLAAQYLGPCPNNANDASDVYEFTLYALSQDSLPGTLTDVASIVKAIKAANPLAQAVLSGTSNAKGMLR